MNDPAMIQVNKQIADLVKENAELKKYQLLFRNRVEITNIHHKAICNIMMLLEQDTNLCRDTNTQYVFNRLKKMNADSIEEYEKTAHLLRDDNVRIEDYNYQLELRKSKE